MRKFMNIVEGKQLNESVDFEPRVKRVEQRDGKDYTVIDYPPDTTSQREEDCKYCEGTGLDYTYEPDPNAPIYEPGRKIKKLVPGTKCDVCEAPWGNGAGKVKNWHYDFPRMRITYMHIGLLCDMLGEDFEHSGYIEPERLPDLKRRLMGIINGKDISQFTRPFTDEQGPTKIDRSGDVPRITRGPRMIGGGVSEQMSREGAMQMLKIVDWAQKNGTGVGWA